MQINKISATPTPTKPFLKKTRYVKQEEVTSLQTCLSELNKYQKDIARSSLNANLSCLSNGAGMSRNACDTSVNSCNGANRFKTDAVE